MLAVFGAVVSCAKEVGRVETSATTAEMTLVAKPVDVWVDLDVACMREPKVSVEVAVAQAGHETSRTVCDALDVTTKMLALETSLGNEVKKKYEGKMRCELAVPVAGTATVTVARNVSANCFAKTLDVVLKQ
jgi:hypothetical protein